MFHKIIEVIPLKNKILQVRFENKKVKYYDVKKIINEIEEFNVLKEQSIFDNVTVDIGGYAVIWNNDLDIDCEELYNNGTEEI